MGKKRIRHKRIINSPKAPPSTSPVAQATAGGGLLFVGGQMPRDPISGLIPDDPRAQAALSLQHCLDILEADGSGPDRVLIVWAYVTDLAIKPIINELFASTFGTDPPARNLVEVRAIGENAVVEFSMIAIQN